MNFVTNEYENDIPPSPVFWPSPNFQILMQMQRMKWSHFFFLINEFKFNLFFFSISDAAYVEIALLTSQIQLKWETIL